tara:strand:- start:197 stop:415 length:219 start_codon:yes stop_codon:yes gene_type:complete
MPNIRYDINLEKIIKDKIDTILIFKELGIEKSNFSKIENKKEATIVRASIKINNTFSLYLLKIVFIAFYFKY